MFFFILARVPLQYRCTKCSDVVLKAAALTRGSFFHVLVSALHSQPEALACLGSPPRRLGSASSWQCWSN